MAFAPSPCARPSESLWVVVRRKNRTIPCANQDFKALRSVARFRHSRAHLIFLNGQATAFLAESCSLNCSCVRVAAGGASLGAWRCCVYTGFYFLFCFIWATHTGIRVRVGSRPVVLITRKGERKACGLRAPVQC